jgi:ribonuclease R
MGTRTDHKHNSDAERSCHRSGPIALTARGFGFVQPDSGPSILVPYDYLFTATSGDTVRVEIFPDSPPDKPAGRVVEVIDRNTAPVVGRVRTKGNALVVIPHANRVSRPLVIKRNDRSRVVSTDQVGAGDIVSCTVEPWTDPASPPVAQVNTVLAKSGEPDAELKLIALSRAFGLSVPAEVIAAAEEIPLPVPKAGSGRVDLRHLDCFTIDPETARDHDDALSVTQTESGLFELGIHIADVTHFVAENDMIDSEARRRSTSVYLVNSVLPMLPERLSTDLCSLVPGKDRFAVSVSVLLDSRGEVQKVTFAESIIRSRRRLSYADAEAIIGGKQDSLAGSIHLLHLITQTLRARRERDGSIDLDFSRPQIRLDENDVPVSVRPAERGSANRMVEECMLLANRLVAERLAASDEVPGLFRVHQEPRPSDIAHMIAALADLGIRYVGAEDHAENYRAVLSIVQNFEFRELMESLASRALSKAQYSTTNTGHFGLAMRAYTHFTSPIRRYPDIVVHRLLKRTLGAVSRRGQRDAGRPSSGGSRKLKSFLDTVARHANERERAASEAEREYIRVMALRFLSTKIGRNYSGVVAGVASVGLFVEIERYLIDGLVHVATLGRERFAVDHTRYALVGSRSGKTFRIGDRVTVKVVAVDVEARTADFVLASPN